MPKKVGLCSKPESLQVTRQSHHIHSVPKSSDVRFAPKAIIRHQSTIRRYLEAARVLDPSQQRPGGGVSEQHPVPNVARQHDVRGMAGLRPDPPCRNPSLRRRRGQPASQRMPAKPGRVEPGSCNPLTDDERYGLALQAGIMHTAMTVHRPEYRPFTYPRGSDPCIERSDGAPSRSSERDADPAAFPELVRLGAP